LSPEAVPLADRRKAKKIFTEDNEGNEGVPAWYVQRVQGRFSGSFLLSPEAVPLADRRKAKKIFTEDNEGFGKLSRTVTKGFGANRLRLLGNSPRTKHIISILLERSTDALSRFRSHPTKASCDSLTGE